MRDARSVACPRLELIVIPLWSREEVQVREAGKEWPLALRLHSDVVIDFGEEAGRCCNLEEREGLQGGKRCGKELKPQRACGLPKAGLEDECPQVSREKLEQPACSSKIGWRYSGVVD